MKAHSRKQISFDQQSGAITQPATDFTFSCINKQSMSRPQGHRKSHSTSALAVIAAGGSSKDLSQSTAATPRASRKPQPSRLGAVVEDDGAEMTNRSPGIDRDLAKLQEAMSARKTKEMVEKPRRLSKPADGLEEVKAAVNDVSFD